MSALLLCHLLMGDVDRANENASMAGKKTIQPNDVIIALKETEFEFMIPRLEAELKSKWPRCLSCIFSFPSLESCPRTLHSHSSRFPPAAKTFFFIYQENKKPSKRVSGFKRGFHHGLQPSMATLDPPFSSCSTQPLRKRKEISIHFSHYSYRSPFTIQNQRKKENIRSQRRKRRRRKKLIPPPHQELYDPLSLTIPSFPTHRIQHDAMRQTQLVPPQSQSRKGASGNHDHGHSLWRHNRS